MSMNGIHHVTAIAGPARRNVAFYIGVLGMRLVKKTVNFDDPSTYHLYYGDEAGSPGTILTFFPWEHVAPGRLGVGETQETVFRVPEASIGYWAHRFIEKAVPHEAPVKRFGETALTFKDPHGTRLALVGVPNIENDPAWSDGTVPAEHAIRGFHSVSLLLDKAEGTAAVLTDVFGFSEVAREDSLIRYQVKDNPIGGIVDLRVAGGFLQPRTGGGTVHHVAFRAADDAAEEEMVAKLTANHGLRPTDQKDRNYFRSIYFREPGGILFEIATDIPGFAVDEPKESLGEALMLPGFLEERRAQVEAALPALH
jgi:glyoxalase family protein